MNDTIAVGHVWITRRRSFPHGIHDGAIDTETAVELDEALQFMRTLWETVHSLQKTSKRMSRTLGITGPQRLVVRAVGLAPDYRPARSRNCCTSIRVR
jgi:hypothetical protein